MPLDLSGEQIRYPDYSFCFQTMSEANIENAAIMFGTFNPASASAEGAALVDTVVPIFSIRRAIELWGVDSVITKMVEQHFCQCGGDLGDVGAVFVVPLAAAGASNEFTYPIAGTATQTGNYYLELPCGAEASLSGVIARDNGNCVYTTFVTAGDTAADVATALVAEINADPKSFWTATDDGAGVITLVAKVPGAEFNNLIIDPQPVAGYNGIAGLTSSWAQTVVDDTHPDITTAMGNLGSCCYLCWGLSTADPVGQNLINQEIEARGGCSGDNCFGHHFGVYYGPDAATINTDLGASNIKEINYFPLSSNGAKYPSFMFTASMTGRQCCHHNANIDNPGVPLVGEAGVLQCMCTSQICNQQWTAAELNEFVFNGVMGWKINADGQYEITNNVTNYKFDDLGRNDSRWSQTSTRYLRPALAADLREFYVENYQGFTVSRNGVELQPGSNQTNPVAIKGHLLGWMGNSQKNYLRSIAQDITNDRNNSNNQAENLVVEFDPYDCNRINVTIKGALLQPLLRIRTTLDVQPCIR